MPSLFWSHFEPELIVGQKCVNSAGGGYEWIHWKSNLPSKFLEKKVKDWATEHGWTFAFRSEYAAAIVETWHNGDNTKLFPLFRPNHDFFRNGYAYDIEPFPRHIDGDVVVLAFSTGVSRVIDTTVLPAYGYIVISKDGSSMAMYNLYGEMPNERNGDSELTSSAARTGRR